MSSYISQALSLVVGRKDNLSIGSSEFFWSVLWLICSVILLSYVCFLYFGSLAALQIESAHKVEMLDTISSRGEHHISGSVSVPSQCHGLSVKTETVSDVLYRIVLTTWQEPTRTCEPHAQVRSFQTVVFAPPVGVSFIATLDGKELPLKVTTRR